MKQQLVVDTLFAELVFNHGDAMAMLLAQDPVEQRGFAAAQKAGQDRDRNIGLSHGTDLFNAGCSPCNPGRVRLGRKNNPR